MMDHLVHERVLRNVSLFRGGSKGRHRSKRRRNKFPRIADGDDLFVDKRADQSVNHVTPLALFRPAHLAKDGNGVEAQVRSKRGEERLGGPSPRIIRHLAVYHIRYPMKLLQPMLI